MQASFSTPRPLLGRFSSLLGISKRRLLEKPLFSAEREKTYPLRFNIDIKEIKEVKGFLGALFHTMTTVPLFCHCRYNYVCFLLMKIVSLLDDALCRSNMVLCENFVSEVVRNCSECVTAVAVVLFTYAETHVLVVAEKIHFPLLKLVLESLN
ncbi:hypothetical protein TNCT_255591 [Trichonephila clavata]|uniref:Uncharacterized protein n=1 Tax=Trichonephila clavata TaxID=2740835 RepID=A0A8X6KMF2_TRICU|nr:hypothetical protein TNCT_255591 [Trichonephila clavata]